MAVRVIEETLMFNMLDLLKWIIDIRKHKSFRNTPSHYYEQAIEYLESIIKVSNDLLKSYKKLKT